MQLYDQHQIF